MNAPTNRNPKPRDARERQITVPKKQANDGRRMRRRGKAHVPQEVNAPWQKKERNNLKQRKTHNLQPAAKQPTLDNDYTSDLAPNMALHESQSK